MTFLVIGSGIAGLNFALKASRLGKVLIITKKEAVDTSTNYAQGGIAGVIAEYDRFEKHIEDTLKAGSYHNNKEAVEFMVRRAPEAIRNLIEYGVQFATEEGKILLTKEGGHSERRIAFVGDYTGKEIERALLEKAKADQNIEIWEHSLAYELLIKNSKCLGAKILRKKIFYNIYADYVFLATGGCGQAYLHTTNPSIATGDGLALAQKIGLETQDLEFIQFHPTVFSYWSEAKFLISEAVRGEGAYLRNKDGERFMIKIHPQAELAPRDIVAQSIFEESKKGPVYLDITHKNPKEIPIRFPQIYLELKKYGFDLTKDLIPITPAAHYCCGGIKVNLNSETTIKNLYACGELACTGVHGANRLASNSLLEAVVFSSAIFNNIQKTNNSKKIDIEIQKSSSYQKLTKNLETQLNQIQKQLKTLMWNKVGIIRRPSEMKKAINEITNLQNTLFKLKTGLNEKIIETENLLITASLITKAALKRKKSLGGHMIAVDYEL
jgi:L-aspartate oxidase